MITKAFFKEWILGLGKNDTSWHKIDSAILQNVNFTDYYECNYNKVKGDIFEYLAKYIYLFNGYKKVYLYNEIPNKLKQELGLPNTDKGIDLVISKDDKKWIGVQCKWRSNVNCSIQKKYVTEFLHEVNNSNLSYGIMFTNVKKITSRFNKIENLKWSIRSDLLNYATKDLLNFIISQLNNKYEPIVKNIKTLRNYQKDAVKALIKSKDNNKQCIMACGTGKTFVMLKYIKCHNYNDLRILFLLPSLQLLSQTCREAIQYLGKFNMLCICSQMDTTSLTMGEANSEEEEEIYNEFLALDKNKIFTTDEDIIKERLKTEEIIVFCTYQSSKLLEGNDFDIAIFDEAHKTVNSNSFGYLLKNDNCEIDERLYLTATPRYYKGNNDTCISMDNKKIYGKEVYNYPFKQAIGDKYILDFKIICYATPPKLEGLVEEKYIKKDGIDIDANDVISAIQLAQHIQNYGTSKKILTYHNSIANANSFKKTLNYIFDKNGINANIFVMSGKTKMTIRSEIFEEFKESNIGIICSSKVLNEGVDIPIIDTVMFVDPRKSTIDVTQCVGRAMRPFKDMEECNIIIPIHYDNIGDVHNFSQVINILTAMSEIDDSIIEYFTTKKKNTKIIIRKMTDIIDIEMESDVKYTIDDIRNNLKIKMMGRTVLSWEIKKALLFEYANKYKRCPESRENCNNIKLGKWLGTHKANINTKSDKIYKDLCQNLIVKKNIDQYLLNREKNKDKQNLSWDKRKDLLFEYCNINKREVEQKTRYKDSNIGVWLSDQKKRISSKDDELYKNLAVNKYVKITLDKFLTNKNKDNNNPTRGDFEEWKKILFEYCDIHKKCPPATTKYKNINIGIWLNHQKKKILSTDDKLYKELSTNKHIKKALDSFLENKTKPNIDFKQVLFEYCDKNNKCPTFRASYNDVKIGHYLAREKKKIKSTNDDLYKQLSKNNVLKEHLDEYLTN